MNRTNLRSLRNEAVVELIGGSAVISAEIVNGLEPAYNPKVLLWANTERFVLGWKLAKPDELLGLACQSLQDTIDRPMFGVAIKPTRVRVDSMELAETLRTGFPELEIVCAPTPELKEPLAGLQKQLATAASATPKAIPPGMETFFQASAALFRAQPWKHIPEEKSRFSVTIEQLQIYDAPLLVHGQDGPSYGFVLFSSLENFQTYLVGAEIRSVGGEFEMPPYLLLNFKEATEAKRMMHLGETADAGWELAGPDAYPCLLPFDPREPGRLPTGQEVAQAEVVGRALTRIMAEKEALFQAWEQDELFSRTFSFDTFLGELEVTLESLYSEPEPTFDASRDFIGELAQLSGFEFETDFAKYEILESALGHHFAASPEAKDTGEDNYHQLIMQLGIDYLGQTIATLKAAELQEILFEIIPRKIAIDPSEAPDIVRDVRVFYTFLKREFALKQADACLRVLTPQASGRLEAALSDSSNFGMAKSLVAAGADHGFNMRTKEGVASWMESLQGRSLPTSILLPEPPSPKKQSTKKKKDKRKAARKARRKNR